MSNAIGLSAVRRERVGKGSSRSARRGGLIPAVIYGGEKGPESVTIDGNAFRKLLGQPGLMSHLISLEVDGSASDVLARDIQFHPVTDLPLHIDFLRVSRSSVVSVSIPVEFINEDTSPGLKSGGVLNIVRHEVELSCPATSIPERITVDLAGYSIGDSIHISAVELPEGVTPTITDRDFTIATIAAPTVEVEPEEPTAEAGEEAEQDKEAAETSEEDSEES